MRVREIVRLCTLLGLQFGRTKNNNIAFGSKLCFVYGQEPLLSLKEYRLAYPVEELLATPPSCTIDLCPWMKSVCTEQNLFIVLLWPILIL
jgi:hypothetical protein